MVARHAVLLTPTKSSCPTQLPFYKQNASVSPLFAILTSPPLLAENTTTLSPFLATHTAPVPVTPLFATLTKTAGVAHPLFPFWNSPLATCRSPLSATEASHSARFSVRTPAKTKISFLYFQHFTHSSAIRGEGRGPLCPPPTHPSPLTTTPLFSYSYELLCTPEIRNSFVFLLFQTPFEKHRGWAYPIAERFASWPNPSPELPENGSSTSLLHRSEEPKLIL